MCALSRSVFTAYSHSNRRDVLSFAWKNLYFTLFLPSFFFVINSGSVLRLSVSGSTQVFLQSRIYLSLRILLEIVKIYKLYGSDLVFV